MLVLIEGTGNGQTLAINMDKITFAKDLGDGTTALYFANDESIEVAIPIREVVSVVNELH